MNIKSLILIKLCLVVGVNCCASISSNQVETIANAIGRVENSQRYPFGIKSIDTHGDKDYARKICINTIKNNIIRFKNQTNYNDYFIFLGSRYCPVVGDKTGLNKNWVFNLKNQLGTKFVNQFNKDIK